MNWMARIGAKAAGFWRDQSGTTLVELAMAVSVFLLILFGAIDFGRFYFHYVAAEKALGVAARTAAVRPPICSGLPGNNSRGTAPTGAIVPEYGSACSGVLTNASGVATGGSICALVIRSCTLASGTGSTVAANEIWGRLAGALPPGATQANVQVSYSFDPKLNFLGGPYVPNVTMELTGLNFRFMSPLGQLARLTAGPALAFDQEPPFPSLSTTVPGEDLATGNDG